MRHLIKNVKNKMMKQILLNCAMHRENLQDPMALKKILQDEFAARGLEKLKVPNRE